MRVKRVVTSRGDEWVIAVLEGKEGEPPHIVDVQVADCAETAGMRLTADEAESFAQAILAGVAIIQATVK